MSGAIYVIVPVYNEAPAVGSVLREVLRHYQNVVCVDDGSTDDSGDVIASTGATRVTHPVNLGAGAAMQTGIEYALQDPDAQFFITIDADGQHDIRDAKRMLEHLQHNNLDVVIGSRFLGSVENMPRSKQALLKLAQPFSRSTSGIKLTDPHNGLLVCNRKFAEQLKLTLSDFSHKSEIVQRIAEHGFKYDEYPVTVKYTEYSKSKGQPMLNAINISFDLLLQKAMRR